MKTGTHLQNQLNNADKTKKHINANIIAEIIAKFIQNYGRIILIISLVIIAIVIGILSYFAWIETSDKEVNERLEAGIAAYMSASSAQNKQQLDVHIASASESFRYVMANAKSKTLKLRAEYELASILFDSKSYLEAARMYSNISQNRSFYLAEPSLYNKGVAELEQQKYDDAINTFETFIKLYPKSYLEPDATLTLANTLYIGKNQSSEALALLRNWLSKNTNENQYTPIFEESISLIENKIY